MAAVGFVLHRERAQAAELAKEAAAWLQEQGHEVRLPQPDAETAGLAELGAPDDQLGPGLDVAVSLGGDGTMLRTVDLVAGAGVPILGVNVGQMGYLTDIEPADLRQALARFLAGEGTIETRMLLAVRVERADGEVTEQVAFNEAVVEKTPMGHTVRLAVPVILYDSPRPVRDAAASHGCPMISRHPSDAPRAFTGLVAASPPVVKWWHGGCYTRGWPAQCMRSIAC